MNIPPYLIMSWAVLALAVGLTVTRLRRSRR